MRSSGGTEQVKTRPGASTDAPSGPLQPLMGAREGSQEKVAEISNSGITALVQSAPESASKKSATSSVLNKSGDGAERKDCRERCLE